MANARPNSARAQTSVEILVILAVVLLAFLTFFMLTQSEGLEIGKRKSEADARNAVSDLASAAKDVYSQGKGARKQAFITLPPGYEPEGSFVKDRAIKISVDGNDYVETVDFEVRGTLPGRSGDHYVWVSSEGSRVLIGQSMAEVSRVSISSIMARGSSLMEGFVLRSNWEEAVNVSLAENWESTQVQVDLSQKKVSLAPLSAEGISVLISAAENASGFHSGSISLSVTDGFMDETIEIPLTVEVVGNGSIAPQLIMKPGSLALVGEPNESIDQEFQVCAYSDVSSVDFTASSDDAGDWASGLSSLGKIEKDVCQPKTITFSIPSGIADGVYSGYIHAQGTGAKNARDSAYFSINVSSPVYGSTGLNISNISTYPERIFVPEPIVISALVQDADNGTIDNCRISLDGGSLNTMDPVDLAYDGPAELVRYTYQQSSSAGLHKARITCTDSGGESQSAEQSFHVMKEILFVTKGSNPSTDEERWIGWIRNHRSMEGNTWSMDVEKSGDFISKSAGRGLYAVIALTDYTEGMDNGLSAHAAAGGSLLILGNGADAAHGLGISESGEVCEQGYLINVIDDSYYITQPFEEGLIQAADGSTTLCSLKGFSGMELARDEGTILGISGRAVFWGAAEPDDLNYLGSNMSVRVLDYAIGESNISPGEPG